MELRVLEYYLMVAREENITKAAQLLHITQPTLSRQLMQLEEELGVSLFERGKHRIFLTDDGLLLKRRAQELVELADKTKKDFHREEGELTGEITIGSGEPQSVRFLGKAAARFHKSYPRVTFHLHSATADDIKDRIEKGLIDIGLLTEPVDVGRYGFIRISRKEQWGVMVDKASPLAGKKGVTPEDLAKVPLFISQRERVQHELANWFGDWFDRLTILGTYNLLYNAVLMTEDFGGAVLCFQHGNCYENAVFVPFDPPLRTGCVVVWKKNHVCTPATGRFIEYLRAMGAGEEEDWIAGRSLKGKEPICPEGAGEAPGKR